MKQLPLFDAGAASPVASRNVEPIGSSTTPHMNPNQLKMLMSAREIHSQYQALDGDRRDLHTPSERGSGSLTARTNDTVGNYNPSAYNYNGVRGRERAQTHDGTGRPARYANRDPRESAETIPQLWDRKLAESKLSPGDYHKARWETDQSLPTTPSFLNHDSFMERGSYPKPPSTDAGTTEYDDYDNDVEVYHGDKKFDYNHNLQYGDSLYRTTKFNGMPGHIPLSQQFGSMGKPQIAGGHHRLAAMTEIDQDKLLPVVHHESIHTAQSDETQKFVKYS